MGWTDERVELLKKLWVDGLSSSQIAKQLGGLTRNSVIGKVHRLGLTGRARASAPKQARTNFNIRKPSPPPSAPRAYAGPANTGPSQKRALAATAAVLAFETFVEPACDLLPIPEEERPRHYCKWPIGDPKSPDYGDCGRGVGFKASGRPENYCEAHKTEGVNPRAPRSSVSGLIGYAMLTDGIRIVGGNKGRFKSDGPEPLDF